MKLYKLKAEVLRDRECYRILQRIHYRMLEESKEYEKSQQKKNFIKRIKEMKFPNNFWIYSLICATYTVLIFCSIIGIAVIFGQYRIVSETRIEPEKQLVIRNNKIDTVYIYKEIK